MSIYRRALGSDFDRLHPKLQGRVGFSSADNIASIGTGVMDEVWHGAFYTLPFLYVGTWRNIMFPESGRNVPFRIYNFAYRDSFGRETLSWFRKFKLNRMRRFSATMIYGEERDRIIDYLGSHQHLAVDIDISVTPRGGMKLISGEQRFHEGPISFRFPMIFSGYAEVEEWFDEAENVFRIEVIVRNRIWGPLFGYRGSFTEKRLRCRPDQVPHWVKPVREERRE